MPRVTFKKNRLLLQDLVVQATPGTTLLRVAQSQGVPMGSNCGGVCGCSTCHAYVTQGLDSLGEPSDKELDRLDLAFDVKLNSRLSCQTRLADQDVVLELTEESLKAFFDENPEIRKHWDATGELLMRPRDH